jgi:hypothetical protein
MVDPLAAGKGGDVDYALRQLCSDKKYCIEEMARIREMWGSKTTFTEKNIDGAHYSLGAMLLYCPEELTDSIRGMIDELGRREALAFLLQLQESDPVKRREV